jgi:hypothetical protein
VVAPQLNRKPHLLVVKKAIVGLIDDEIERMITKLGDKDPGFEKEDREIRRNLAIWIRQRNRLAKDADEPLLPLSKKDGQGNFIYKVD